MTLAPLRAIGAHPAARMYGVGLLFGGLWACLSAAQELSAQQYLQMGAGRLAALAVADALTRGLGFAAVLTTAALLLGGTVKSIVRVGASRRAGPSAAISAPHGGLAHRLAAAPLTGLLATLGASLLAATLSLHAGLRLYRVLRPSTGPNVILIVVDTLRYDHLGFAGYERPTSPALDRLAATALSFERAYSQAPWTSPSVAALLTSRTPGELGYGPSRTPARLADRTLLLPELMREAGYDTGAVVSHTYVGRALGFDQGWDSFDEDNARGHEHVSSPSVLRKATAFLDAHEQRPFFLFVHFFDPHFNYVQHDGFDFDPRYDGTLQSGESYGELQRRAGQLDARDRDHLRALYDSEIRFTDEHVGRLLDELRARGLYDDAVIVFTADHGEAFLDRPDGWIGHGITLYDELIHVPLLIKPAGFDPAQGRTVRAPVGLIDVLPTLAQELDLELPADHRLEGRALPLGDAVVGEHPPVFSETKARGHWLQSVVAGEHKLIVDRHDDTAALFNLVKDPGETVDLGAAQPDEARPLRDALDAWSRRMAELQEAHAADAAEFTQTELEALRSLGYLE